MENEGKAVGNAGPLTGIRVLDFSRILAGPYATLVLADLGAEVIKVESVTHGDETRSFPPFKGPFSHYFIALNRNKKSLSLDLKSERGIAVAKDLARNVDVVVENFRPGVMDRLGLGYQALSTDNPRLCYCSISGFGSDSPLRDEPAFDIVAQALSGVMSINREPGAAPNRLGIPLGDMAGGIFAVFGILAALVERQRTGKGGRLDISMLDGLLGMLGYLAQIFFVSGKSPEPVGNKHPNIVPYGAFPTRDGHVIVACLTDAFWRNFASALDRSDLSSDPRFDEYATRLLNRDALEAIIADRMKRDDTTYWLMRLREYDVPSAPILDIGQALEQPHTLARNLIAKAFHPLCGELNVVRTPLKFGETGFMSIHPPPMLGEHSSEILSAMLGTSDKEIRKLIDEGVVYQFEASR